QAYDVYTSQAGLTLGSYLVRLMAGQVGRHVPFTQWPTSLSVADHWSLMVMELLSILPNALVSGSNRIAFLAATPNLNIKSGAPLRPTSVGQADGEEGAFGVIQVQTSGDIGDLDAGG
ncbi:MAG TPA: hypothetical protein VKP66_15920, partial [Steroidobacteraceae bacterium]|nr:hypothetical protein [Steroidobacteraceae bacterium]